MTAIDLSVLNDPIGVKATGYAANHVPPPGFSTPPTAALPMTIKGPARSS